MVRARRSRRGADLVLSEATYQHDDIRAAAPPVGAAGRAKSARAAGARRLVLTHLWPTIDPNLSWTRVPDAFGRAVTLAAPT